MHWERLLDQPLFGVRRSGRYLVADLHEPHVVLSTSVRNGGQVSHVRYLLNHQSCEGTAHHARHGIITEAGLDAYHDVVCGEAALPADCTAVMGTAANMNYVAIAREADERVTVTAVVTAGVEGNATAAGEPASWRETEAGIHKVPAYDGTINTMVLIGQPLTPGALARVVVTMTEGKTAALQRLAVPSKRHIDTSRLPPARAVRVGQEAHSNLNTRCQRPFTYAMYSYVRPTTWTFGYHTAAVS